MSNICNQDFAVFPGAGKNLGLGKVKLSKTGMELALICGSGVPVEGFVDCSFLSTGSLAARQAGTVIATGHMAAAVTYWR